MVVIALLTSRRHTKPPRSAPWPDKLAQLNMTTASSLLLRNMANRVPGTASLVPYIIGVCFYYNDILIYNHRAGARLHCKTEFNNRPTPARVSSVPSRKSVQLVVEFCINLCWMSYKTRLQHCRGQTNMSCIVLCF